MSAVDAPEPQLTRAVASELARHDRSLAHALLDALIGLEDGDDLDPGVWGPAPSAEEVLTATVNGHRIIQAARRGVLADSLTRRDAAEQLGVGPQQVSRVVEDGHLVALEEGGQLRLPAWQFHPDAPKGRLAGIREVFTAFSGGPVTFTQWSASPNPALSGRTPAQALLDGDVSRAALAARHGT